MMSRSLALRSATAAIGITILAGVISSGATVYADRDDDNKNACNDVPSHAKLKAALIIAQGNTNGGFGLNMWGSIVNRDGIVCVVAFTGGDRGDQWPGSRIIAAQKANTANSFSLPGLALSTANLWAAVQPGGSLFGLQESNPVDTGAAYQGPSTKFGTSNDPLVGNKIGGVNVFGGGLALYDKSHKLVGAIGVSGDTSCADHNIAWRARNLLNMDHVPGGVGFDSSRPDNINYQGLPSVPVGTLAYEFSHPTCPVAGVDTASSISAALPPVTP
jgi:uncharacterized protein GlcG (DUF336 family)